MELYIYPKTALPRIEDFLITYQIKHRQNIPMYFHHISSNYSEVISIFFFETEFRS